MKQTEVIQKRWNVEIIEQDENMTTFSQWRGYNGKSKVKRFFGTPQDFLKLYRPCINSGGKLKELGLDEKWIIRRYIKKQI